MRGKPWWVPKWMQEVTCSPLLAIHEIDKLFAGYEQKKAIADRKFNNANQNFIAADAKAREAVANRNRVIAELTKLNAEIKAVAARISSVKANLTSLREVSFTYESELGDYRIALRVARALDLESTRGSIARKVRLEHQQLADLQSRSAEMLSGNGIQLSSGDRICKIN